MPDTEEQKAFKFHILSYTDTHGRYLSKMDEKKDEHSHGLDRLSSYLKELRKKDEPVLLIENGDSIQGYPLVDLHDFNSPMCENLPHPLAIVHRELRVDCFVVGNHEFNFGIKHLKKIEKESNIPWLAANIYDSKTGEHFFSSSHFVEKFGFKIGVLGLITEFVPKLESSSFVSSLVFKNVIDVAGELIPKLKSQCDYLVVVYHGGLEKNPITDEHWSIAPDMENRGLALWETYPEIDLLLTGHQHRELLYRPDDPKRAEIIQPSCFGKLWSHTVLEVQPRLGEMQEHRFAIKQKSSLIQASKYSPDPEFVKKFEGNLRCIQGVLETPAGKVGAEFAINDPMKEVWLKKHPLIQWINNLLRQATGARIAACSLLDAKVRGLPENVTMGDIFKTYFFQDTFCLMRVDGKTLKEALEQVASFFTLDEEDGQKRIDVHPEWRMFKIKSYNYDIYDGIEYGFDIGKPVGKRLAWLRFNQKDVGDLEELVIATTSFRAGGAFYKMFSTDKIIQEFTAKITDLMTNDLMTKKLVDVVPIQNFKVFY
ncbi:MAG: 5'-nucleotidase C-terminal domain-containing protein [Deltaproteobacteria bacterium]|nr:5'-nucleotidase C-terminal domain-containing protein [Deltaproteobacteria bacterium]